MATFPSDGEVTFMHARDLAFQITSTLIDSTSGRPVDRTVQFMVEVNLLRNNARPTLTIGHDACVQRLRQAKRYGLHQCNILLDAHGECVNDPRRVARAEADVLETTERLEAPSAPSYPVVTVNGWTVYEHADGSRTIRQDEGGAASPQSVESERDEEAELMEALGYTEESAQEFVRDEMTKSEPVDQNMGCPTPEMESRFQNMVASARANARARAQKPAIPMGQALGPGWNA